MPIDLSNYVRIARYDLPEPTRTAAPANNLLAQEVSAVTYNKDTDTLFVLGDGGTSITQVSKTGELIDTMTLATGSSPQGTEFYDPEGLTYIGNGQFVMVEERDRQAVLFTYEAGGTLTRAEAKTVQIGTNVGNVGLEGLTYDPLTGGYVFVKEKSPEGVFQTTIDFENGTASNGSPTTINSTDLFDPALLNVIDLADVFALSNLGTAIGTSEEGNLLLLSQESAKILEVDRAGNVLSTLTLQSDPGNPLDIVSQQHEGLTMDADGYLYVVSENGGGDFDHPQLWVYAPSTAANAAPTAVSLTGAALSIDENTSTVARIKVADVNVTDDGLGTNALSVSGADAASFEVDSTGLYVKAGVVLDFETKSSYSVTVDVDDTSVGATPDASTSFTLAVNDIAVENTAPAVYISEVAPWSSGNSPVGADWFEVTNGGSSALDISGWRVDDGSASFATSAALNGVTSIGAGQSVIFIETSSTATVSNFVNTWFGGTLPSNVQIGTYSGSGLGLSTGGDGVTLFDSTGAQKASVTFGASPASAPYATFNNAAGLNNATLTTLSAVSENGAFVAPNSASEIGSPGSVGRLIVSEVAPWSSGSSPVGADWFELTNTSAFAIDITGWKMDDSSGSPAGAVALNGVTTIAPGESVIFIESANAATAKTAFLNAWFGGNAPANLQIGTYTGSGVGLGTGGDAVNIYDNTNVLRASVSFGTSPSAAPFATFDNARGLNGVAISTLSAIGTNAGFQAVSANEVGSPGEIAPVNDAPVALDDALSGVAEDSGAYTISFASLIANDRIGPANETGQTLTITGVSNAVGGTVSIVGTDVVFTPTENFNGTASFEYTVRDNGTSYGRNAFLTDKGLAAFTVTPVNDAPTLTSGTSFVVAENTKVVGTVSANDIDSDALEYAISGGADAALFAIDKTSGTIQFIDAPDFETAGDADRDGIYSIDVSTSDGNGGTALQTLAITVTDVAEAGRVINGTIRADTLAGTTGNDVVNANNGNDIIAAGDGNDTVLGGNGNDQINGDRGNDLLSGDTGADILDGGLGDDLLFGGNGDDQLTGGEGNDQLFGDIGSDRLLGGAGDDLLVGGAGRDFLFGGLGADTFLIERPLQSSADVVLDFESGVDLIQLEAAEFGLAAGGLDSAMLTFGLRATGAQAQFVYNSTNGRLMWDADGAGGSAGVTVATFDDGARLTYGDFILI